MPALLYACAPEPCPEGFSANEDGLCLQNMDEDSGSGVTDADGDGYTVAEGDCDDAAAAVNPGASETCGNGVDDNCDGSAGTCGWAGDYDLPADGLAVLGERAGDSPGLQLSVGDQDGDGQSDLLVGVPYADEKGQASGLVAVVRGPITAAVSLEDADFRALGGAELDVAGAQAAFVGDLDGDGAEEMIAVAPGKQATYGFNPAVYLLRGGLYGEVSLESVGELWEAEAADDGVGLSVAAVGDVTGDGLPDVLLGASSSGVYLDYAGAAYILSGPAVGGGQLEDADVRILGDRRSGSESLGLGQTVSAAGDLNADGVADVAIGAAGYYTGSAYPGAVYVFFGPLGGNYTASQADALILGPLGDDGLAGEPGTVAPAGDGDGDGYDDLALAAVSAHHGDDTYAGAVAVMGGDRIGGDMSVATADGVFYGGADNEAVGYGLSNLDADGDGKSDLVIGAPGEGSHGRSAGAAYLIVGPLTGSQEPGDELARFLGDGEGWSVGYRTAAGELTGDGVFDLVIAAPSAPGDVAQAGAVFVLPGGGF